jgi:signal transduction histidine kinase
VVRHAGANVCRVRIRTRDDVYALEVEDDGRGPGNAEGGGLRGMRERVGALGGHVDVARATPRGGTRVRVTIPAAAAAAARPAEGVAQSSENAVQRTANATRSAAAAGPAANVAGPATDVARPTAEAETA